MKVKTKLIEITQTTINKECKKLKYVKCVIKSDNIMGD